MLLVLSLPVVVFAQADVVTTPQEKARLRLEESRRKAEEAKKKVVEEVNK